MSTEMSLDKNDLQLIVYAALAFMYQKYQPEMRPAFVDDSGIERPPIDHLSLAIASSLRDLWEGWRSKKPLSDWRVGAINSWVSVVLLHHRDETSAGSLQDISPRVIFKFVEDRAS